MVQWTWYLTSAQLSPFLKSTALNMAIDPSNFLWALKCKISSTRSAPFDFNSQQDVAEILDLVFDELKGTSVRTADLLSNTLRTTITWKWNSCFCSAVRQKKLDIVLVPIAAHVNSSLKKFVSSELLTWVKMSGSVYHLIPVTKVLKSVQSAPILVIHLKRFCVERDKLSKIPSFSSAFLKTFFRSESLKTTKFLFWRTTLWWPQLTIQAV